MPMMMDWKPIVTAKKDGTSILIYNNRVWGGAYRVAYWDEDSKNVYKWHVEDAAEGFNHHQDWPTHWTELPPPPK